MPAPILNFPIAAVVDGLISYIQFVFGNPDITPATYRWNQDTRATRIRVQGPFVIDNEKPMSAPFIVVERGSFAFQNRALDNLKSADPNTFANKKFVDIADGYVNIICGSGVASEATSIANFLAIIIQANRHGIINELKFIRDLHYVDISPEVPVVKDTEVRRWEVTLRVATSIQLNWFKMFHEPEPAIFERAGIYILDKDPSATSDSGVISEGQDIIVDSTKDFGLLTSNDPQLLEQELNRGWYYVRLTANESDQLYTVVEIVDNHTLRLQTHDENNDPVPWAAPESATDVGYELLWNSLHVHMELPTNS